MPGLPVTIKEEQSEILEELSGEDGESDSKSEAVRNLIQCGEIIHEVEEREQRIEKLQSQLSKRSRGEEKIENLPDEVCNKLINQIVRDR